MIGSRDGRRRLVVLRTLARWLFIPVVLLWAALIYLMVFHTDLPMTRWVYDHFFALSLTLVALLLGAVFVALEQRSLSVADIAVVGALAAFSAALRIPFAALPSIQPCTFLILLTGYVYGPRLGFLVGAVTPLASNFFLGHGPWTPWQMFAWGLVGVSGVLLRIAGDPLSNGLVVHHALLPTDVGAAAASNGTKSGPMAQSGASRRGRSLRHTLFFTLLATIGFVWGFLFGWITTFSLFMYTPFSIRTYLLFITIGLPFDLMHAIGNILFAVMFGPPVLWVMVRFRRRFHIEYGGAASRVGEDQSEVDRWGEDQNSDENRPTSR